MIFLCNEEKKTSFEDFFKGGDHGDGLLETDKILGDQCRYFSCKEWRHFTLFLLLVVDTDERKASFKDKDVIPNC